MPHLIRPLIVALVATIADFIWFEYGVRHTTAAGIIHGAGLLLAVGLVLGHAAGAIWRGAPGGILAGVGGALAYYAVPRSFGYVGALLVAWTFMWIVLAAVNAWARNQFRGVNEWMLRGVVAAVASGVAFYFVSGIWTARPPEGGRNYVWHLVAWTIAWAPGLFAMTAQRSGSVTRS